MDDGQRQGTVRSQGDGKSKGMDDGHTLPLREVLGAKDDQQANDAVRQARSLRDALAGQDIDQLS